MKCPSCSGMIYTYAASSYYISGAKWTDGMTGNSVSVSMMRWLERCPYCDTVVWCDEVEQVASKKLDDEYSGFDMDILNDVPDDDEEFMEYLNRLSIIQEEETDIYDPDCIYLEGYKAVEYGDYHLKLKEPNLSKDKLVYLRTHIWQNDNHKRRLKWGERPPMPVEEKDNILKLYDVLDITDDDQRIVMAEIKRELGEFEEVKQILEKPFGSFGQDDRLYTIIKHTKRENPFVEKIFPQVYSSSF